MSAPSGALPLAETQLPRTGVIAGPSLRECLAVFALGALLFLPGIGNHDLWNPDEARYAEVAREMLVDDSPLIPRLNGAVYTQKPPLHFWSIMGASVLTGG